MSRNLKALGLAVLAVLAMSAVVSSAAQGATKFTAETYPATVTGAQTVKHQFTAAGTGVQCSTATFHGSAAAATSSLTMTPTYTGCKDEIFGFGATVTMNGCDYLFTTPGALSGENATGNVDLVCPAGKVIEVHASTCTLTVLPKTGLTSVTYTNQTAASPKKDVVVDIAITNIKFEAHDGFLCPIASEFDTKVKENGIYHGTATVTADNAAGAQQGVDVG